MRKLSYLSGNFRLERPKTLSRFIANNTKIIEFCYDIYIFFSVRLIGSIMKINSPQGKKIGVYDPKTTSSLEDISSYLKKLNRLSTIRAICELKPKFEINNIGDIPIVEEIANYCIICAIKHCDINNGINFTNIDFVELYRQML